MSPSPSARASSGHGWSCSCPFQGRGEVGGNLWGGRGGQKGTLCRTNSTSSGARAQPSRAQGLHPPRPRLSRGVGQTDRRTDRQTDTAQAGPGPAGAHPRSGSAEHTLPVNAWNARLDFPDTCLTWANQTERTNSSRGVEKAAWKGQQLYFKTKKKNQYEMITAIIVI